jgi:hypothetical protein
MNSQRAIRAIFIFAAFVIIVFTGCKKSEEFINPVHNCDCGSLKWDGEEFQLLTANYIIPDTANFLSRRYYISANVGISGESDTHNINVVLEVDSVDQVNFFVETSEDLAVRVENVNYNDPITSLRLFEPVQGQVVITPAILGGTEKVSFNLVLKENYNGDLVGFPVNFSGTFYVGVVY